MITYTAQQSEIDRPKTKAYTMVSSQSDRMAGSVPVRSSTFAENIAELDVNELSESSEEYDTNPDPDLNTDNSFGFADIVDMINPLQHIPIVSSLYQSATGDTIGSIATIVGGAIFGGPLGALVSAGMVAYKAAQSDSSYQQNLTELEGTTIAMADLRQGYKPYNT